MGSRLVTLPRTMPFLLSLRLCGFAGGLLPTNQRKWRSAIEDYEINLNFSLSRLARWY